MLDRIRKNRFGFCIAVGVLFTAVFLFTVLVRSQRPEPIYSAFSDSPRAVRPKLMLSYNVFDHEGIKESYLEVFFPRENNTYLRMQHPTYDQLAILEFNNSQTIELLAFLDQYVDKVSEDRIEKEKNHMVGMFHSPSPAQKGKSLAINVDYTTERLKYRLFFGKHAKSPVLDVGQLQKLRETIAAEVNP